VSVPRHLLREGVLLSLRKGFDKSLDRYFCDFLIGEWGLAIPDLILSVTGGAQAFLMKPQLQRVFNTGHSPPRWFCWRCGLIVSVGIAHLVRDNASWIITAGLRAGVMEKVGQAVASIGETKVTVLLYC
jgi:hypothetical protein